MYNNSGLSLEQAPPISVVLRFFITAAVFGIVAGVLTLLFGVEIFDASSKEARVITHILTLGVMASFMMGALFQMLPVIAGVVLQNPSKKATFVHITLTLGVIMIALAFYTSQSYFYLLSALLLGSSLLFVSAIMIANLRKLPSHSSSSKGMFFALIAFSVTVVLGMYLLLALGGYHDGTMYGNLKEMHYSFGLFGWVSLLIIAISFQVIEMFFVTAKYPDWIQKYLIMILFSLLFITPFTPPIMIALPLMIYAGFTLHRLSKRKRPTSDASVWFWRFGMGLLIVTMLLWIADLEAVKYITFIFFALSIVFAMVYKIVPFLVWFHLSNQGYMSAPLMFDIIPPKRIKWHFYLHVITFSMWALSSYDELLPQWQASTLTIASFLLIGSFGYLLYHLINAVKIYRHTQKYSEKISW